ncbi:hypothetical protein [Cellulophaga sp. BC115SP]|uniref:TolB family protein n=1 Tax=Cellulophaga sp. BC115SP TaxID=2683263 RepID=UPI001412D810|nr:hypothetical protein [Cellulophaga sp. BC115SP]NBB28858.1 hypothetical protein [Cellulophaga sp. BC115SP]
MKKSLLLVFGLLSPFLDLAQVSTNSLQQNPPSVRWSKINTPHFRLIFPTTNTEEGQRLANVLETVYEPVSSSLGKNPRKISVLLQNQTTISNGFVTLLPRRSEFFVTPPQDPNLLGTNNWLDLLAVHEFRHVVQNDKALTGISKLAYYLFGNNGLGVVSSLTAPNWFKEGDAVGVETAMTPSGRGRIPSFDMALRAQLTSGKIYPYAKAVTESYKDYIPNYYVSGYFLTTYLKKKYGNDAWDKVLTGTYQFPFYPFSFSNNIKKVTGLRVEDLYKNAFLDIQKEWIEEQSKITENPATQIASKDKYFSNYLYPQYLPDGRILVVKTGLDIISQLVAVDKNGEEEKIAELGIWNDAGMLSLQGTKVVWAEIAYDARWARKDYSVIKTYDFNEGKIRTLTHKTKYAAPSLNTDATKIVCVESTPEQKYSLVVLDAQSGQVLQKISNPTNAFLLHPRWTKQNEIVFVKLKDGKKTITKTDLSGKETALFASSQENLAHPVLIGDSLFFNSGVTGIDNVYLFCLDKQARYQVTNRKLGGFNPAISQDGKELIFNDFTKNGHRLAYMPLHDSDLKEVNPVSTKRYFGEMVLKEAHQNLLKQVPNQSYEVSKYSKFNIFNIYSWGAMTTSSGNTLYAGLSSQDLLGTTAISGGYSYNMNEQTSGTYANLSFQTFYPMLDVSLRNTQRKTSIYLDNAQPLDSLASDRWNQQELLVGLRVPLNFTKSKYIQSLSFSANWAMMQVNGYDLGKRYVTESYNGLNQSMIYTFSYARQLKQSVRDIAPKWAQSVNFYYRNAFASVIDGGLAAVQASLYTPGLAPHHSLRLRGGFQQQFGFKNQNGSPNDKLYVYGSPIAYTRGYSYRNYEYLNTLSVDYKMPLATPDWNIGRWVYLKRIKTNFFADLSHGETNYDFTVRQGTKVLNYKGSDIGNFKSFGLDISGDFHWMRFSQSFEAGIRFVYLQNLNQFLIQPVVLDIGF